MESEKDFVSLEVAKLLSEVGFDEWCNLYWSTGSYISDETIEKYGELSDDGFYELTKEGGGELDWDEVYSNEWHLEKWNNKNSIFKEDKENGYSAPLLYYALKYIRNKFKYDIEVMFESNVLKYYMLITNISNGETIHFDHDTPEDCIVKKYYDNREELIDRGLFLILKYIKKNHVTKNRK